MIVCIECKCVNTFEDLIDITGKRWTQGNSGGEVLRLQKL